ncbi:hypothetical protein ANANG_G00172300 [Anguilla anguilla]|uniref:Uncharacterized protein n=1 Tax=Anguilla anguilla TaxID=7936 RepID=A0A9D3RT52_ANGAN|nr:hypothetical protein ANANG_G00172300 [Anguilla anguilla]
MDLFWFVVIILIVKIIFYICWYLSRQRRLATYIGNPCDTQVVIVGGRAYRHQMSVSPIWRGGTGEGSAEETSRPLPPTAPYSQLDAPPPYQAVSSTVDELKPPPYSDCVHGGASGDPWINSATTTHDPQRVTDAPPPYQAHPHMAAGLPQHPQAGEGLPRAGL